MLRWLLASVLLAVGCVAVVAILTPALKSKPHQPTRVGGTGPTGGGEAEGDQPVKAVVMAGRGAGQALVVQDARVMAMVKQEVPSERDGKLICLATEVTPEEEEALPPGKVFEQEFGRLLVEVRPGDQTPTSGVMFLLPGQGTTLFRRSGTGEGTEKVGRLSLPFQGPVTTLFRLPGPDEEPAPGLVHLWFEKKKLRPLEWGAKVKKDQLLALVNPAIALEDMASKVAKLDAAQADVRASDKTCEEAKRRVRSMDTQRRLAGPRAVSEDDYQGAVLSVNRYREETHSKQAQVKVAQRELNGALTTVKMHEIRAAIDGVVKFVYKYDGDAVKNLEPVVQIQNPDLLRVEGLVEVQDARDIHRRLEEAQKARLAAYQRLVAGARALVAARRGRDKGQEQKAKEEIEAARRQMKEAERPLMVTVEASRPEPPRAVLRGHMKDVTCVAVSKGRSPWIVSGSEDQTVRVWVQGRGAGKAAGWREHSRLPHGAAVRALACTPPTASANLLLTGTANGIGRLFDLDRLEYGETRLEHRHSGAIACVAFSPDGKWCATGGEDRSICVWETATGKRLSQRVGAHKAPLTSLKFASATKLVSAAGRDPRLLAWAVEEDGKLGAALEIGRRSGEVKQLDVSPEKDKEGNSVPQYVLFDEGRELRVLTLDGQKIVGALQNPPGAVNFATMALFSADGQMVLTDGAAPGRLQLWRAPSALVEGPGGGPARAKARAAELRQFLWSTAPASCGAFAPEARFAVTGMQDHQVLVWDLPETTEVDRELTAQLSYVEQFLDSSLKKVPVRADIVKPPEWMIPGLNVTLVIPPAGGR
jgi:WD40 repeat protein